MIKEPTANTFVFRREAGALLTALVWHPRLECWLPSGGHVESTENTAEAAIREAREETGLDVQLVPGPAAPCQPVTSQGLVRSLVDHGNGGLA